MYRVLSIVLIFLSVSCSANVFAKGLADGAKIEKIRVDLDGRAMIFFDTAIEGERPSCVSNHYKNAFAVDASTEGGKAVLSFALAAKASNATVKVYGMDYCGVYGSAGVETWNHGFIF